MPSPGPPPSSARRRTARVEHRIVRAEIEFWRLLSEGVAPRVAAVLAARPAAAAAGARAARRAA